MPSDKHYSIMAKDKYSLPSNVEPVESLQHHLYLFLKQKNSDNYFKDTYCISVLDDTDSNDFAVNFELRPYIVFQLK